MITPPLVLSLFPGIGLLDMAFEKAGFCVVRGPDVLWGGDIRRFHPPAWRFDGVIGGPPCQAFSRLRHLVEYNGYAVAENLIPEYERVIGEAMPVWFVMENVPDAPLPSVLTYSVHAQLLRDVWVGGETPRLRRISFGTHERLTRLHVEALALHKPDPGPAALASGSARPVPVKIEGSGKAKRSSAANLGYTSKAQLARACVAQGLPADFLDDSPFTVDGKCKVVGNGVPLPMGRAIARAVRRAMYPEWVEAVA